MAKFQTSLELDQTITSLIRRAVSQGIDLPNAKSAAGFLVNTAKKMSANAFLFETAIQEGGRGFLESVERFEKDRGVPFCSFSKFYILGRIAGGMKISPGITPQTLNKDTDFQELIEDSDCMPDGIAVDRENHTLVRQFVERLPGQLRIVATRVFWDGYNMADVARELGISRMAITKRMEKIRRLGLLSLKSFVPTANAA